MTRYDNNGHISDIFDHNNLDLHFGYDPKTGYLAAMFQGYKSSVQRSFGFCYGGFCGGQDANPVLSQLPVLNLLTADVIPQGLTTITDPRGANTQISYAAPNGLTQDPCPGQAGSLQLLALVGLLPKCVAAITDRGLGSTNITYQSNSDGSNTATIKGPLTATNPTNQTLGGVPANGAGVAQETDVTDASGRPIQETDPMGRITTWSWTQPSLEPPSPSPSCATVQDLNSLQQLTRASGTSSQTTTSYCYDANGRLSDRWGPTAAGQDPSKRHDSIVYLQSSGPATVGNNMQAPSNADAGQSFVSDPTSLTDADGHTYTFTPDPSDRQDGLVTQVTDPAGNTWKTYYDTAGAGGTNYDAGHGLVTDEVDPLGNDTQTGYGANGSENDGLPVSVTAPGASTSTWYQYDQDGNLLSVTDPRGPQGARAVDPTAPTDGTAKQPFTTYYAYDALNRMSDEWIARDAQHNVFITRHVAYDPNDNVSSSTNANGDTTSYGYTKMDWLASQTTPALTQADGSTAPPEVTSYCYDSQGDRTDEVLPLGQATAQPCGSSPVASTHGFHWTYDLDGERIVQQQVAGDVPSRVTSYAYNDRGDQIGMADAADNAPSDPVGLQNPWQNAEQATSGTAGPWRTETTYDSTDAPIATVQNASASAGGQGRVYTARTQYDATGNILAVQAADNPASQTVDPATGEYNLAGASGMTSYGYDTRGLLTSVTDPVGNETQYVRRGDGKICAIIAPRGTAAGTTADCTSAGTSNPWKTLYSYYTEGWLKQISLPVASGEYSYAPDPMTVQYTRDPAGYPTTITDPRGNSFKNTFFDDGELQSTARPSWWTYDPQGTGTAGPDPNTGGSGQVGSSTPGAGMQIREKTLQEIYQAAQTQTQTQAQLPASSGQGKFGAVTAQQLPGILPQAGQATFGYDGEGWLTSVQDQLATGQVSSDTQGTTRLTYDQLGKMIELDQPYDGSSSLSSTYYGYDGDGNKAFTSDPRSTSPSDQTYRTTYAYNGLDQLSQVTAPGTGSGPQTTSYQHTLDPGLTVPGYDPNHANPTPAVSVAERVAQTTPDPNASGPATVTTYRDYDALGNEIASTDALGNETTSAYDAVGNRTEVVTPRGNPSGSSQDLKYATTSMYDLAGRMTSSTDGSNYTTAYSYDQNGNVSRVSAPGARSSSDSTSPLANLVTSYDYNGRDLPWKTTTGTGSDARTTITQYDANGNAIRTVSPAGVTPIDGSGQESSAAPYYGYPAEQYGASDTAAAADPNANIDATIRVYDQNNMLQSVYLPWGCNNTSNTTQSGCTPVGSNSPSTGNDTRRFKEDFGRTADGMDRVASIRQAYDWTNPKSYSSSTTYAYFPNGWIHIEKDPSLTDAPSGTISATSETTNYLYDQAGNETMADTNGSTPGTASMERTVNRSYWPDAQLQNLTATAPPSNTPAHGFQYQYEPTGQLAQVHVTANTDGAPGETDSVCYDAAGRQTDVNENLTGASPGLDTAVTYDANGNTTTRQTDGQLPNNNSCPTNTQTSTPQANYSNGQATKFAYNNLDQEVSMSVASNPSTQTPPAPAQPNRTFTTSYWPSGQVQERTRQQGGGAQITDNLYYNDDGTLAEANRQSPASDGTDNQDQTYTYDTNGNRTADERGKHYYNALDQEVLWIRGGQDTASAGTSTAYTLNGTGALLQQIASTTQSETLAGVTADIGTTTTTRYCSQQTANLAPSTGNQTTTGCQQDANRVENATSTTAITTTLPGVATPAPVTYNYCYDALGNLARITQVTCPADPTDLSLQTAKNEQASTTTRYAYNAFEQQKTAIAPDPNSSATNPTIATEKYQYDAFDRPFAKTVQLGQKTALPSTYGYVGLSNNISTEQVASPSGTGQYAQAYDYNSSGQRMGVYRAADPNSSNSTLQNAAYHTYALDANGSVAALENPDGSISTGNRYHYTPYGNLEQGASEGGNTISQSFQTPEQSLAPDAESNNYRFEGFYNDTAINTYALPARNYLPASGTYTTQDRFEAALGSQALQADPLTQNLYAFAGGNPTSNVELDGHAEIGFGAQKAVPVPGGPPVCTEGCGPTGGTGEAGQGAAAGVDSGSGGTTPSTAAPSRVTIGGTTFTHYSAQAVSGIPMQPGAPTGVYLPAGVTLANYKLGLLPLADTLAGTRSPAVVGALGANALSKLGPNAAIVLPPPACHAGCQVAGFVLTLAIPDLDLLNIGRAIDVATAGASHVLLDTSAAIRFKTALGALREGELPVMSDTGARELADVGARKGFSGALPSGVGVIVPDEFGAVGQVLSVLRQLNADPVGIENDAIIASTAITRGIALITGDEAQAAAVTKLGFEARYVP